MPPDLALLSALIGSNYPCLELIFMVPKVFESLKFDWFSFHGLTFICPTPKEVRGGDCWITFIALAFY